MDKARANRQTVDQLRLYLKEAAKEKDKSNNLPAGLNRLRLEELQKEAGARGILTEKKTRQELIHDIRVYEGVEPPPGQPKSTTSGSTATRTASPMRPQTYRPAPRAPRGSRERSTSQKRKAAAEAAWMDISEDWSELSETWVEGPGGLPAESSTPRPSQEEKEDLIAWATMQLAAGTMAPEQAMRVLRALVPQV